MKKTYIAPTLLVDETEIEGVLAMSLQLSNDTGNEEYVKEQDGEDAAVAGTLIGSSYIPII